MGGFSDFEPSLQPKRPPPAVVPGVPDAAVFPKRPPAAVPTGGVAPNADPPPPNRFVPDAPGVVEPPALLAFGAKRLKADIACGEK